MDELNRTQMIMLVLLTSFITSLATGIVTVSLMNQAPIPLTQTVHKVIEKVTTIDNSQVAAPLFLPEEKPTQEERIVKVIDSVAPAVVSIVATKDLPVFEQSFIDPFPGDDILNGLIPDIKIPQYKNKGTEKKEVSSGTGFFVSKKGLILTNKHVVADTEAEYSILMNNGKKYGVKVLARDPFQDIAILQVENPVEGEKPAEYNFNFISLGDSVNLKEGQSVIAIGNALGEFSNTISVGIISGLHRNIVATGSIMGAEQLRELIQTDAAINPGNSGGPLLDLEGRVIGINTAMAQSAQSVGFALPINIAKRDIEDAISFGKIKYPFIGIIYNSNEKGIILVKGEKGESAIEKDSPAEKVGLKEGDIIMEINGEKLDSQNSLTYILSKHRVGDEVELEILREERGLKIKVVLSERPEEL